MGTSNAATESGRGMRPRAAAVRRSRVRRQSWLRKHGVTLVLVLALIVGLGLLAYPTVSNWMNQVHQSRVVMNYTRAVSEADHASYEKMLKDARSYNKQLAKTGPTWVMDDAQKAEYGSLLNVDGTGVMCYLQIPKIGVQLPVYHGTDDAVLQTSIGHIAGTSLPVGGKSTHTVLSGHRGLPSARLFSDLDQLKEGDTFTLDVLDRTLTYEVDQIRVVEPDDLSDLQIVAGQDLCTLVTCTPYGINTQRLLVRGHRVPNANGTASVVADAVVVRPALIAPFLAVPIVLFLLVYTFVATGRHGRKAGVEGAYLAARGLSRPLDWLADGIGGWHSGKHGRPRGHGGGGGRGAAP